MSPCVAVGSYGQTVEAAASSRSRALTAAELGEHWSCFAEEEDPEIEELRVRVEEWRAARVSKGQEEAPPAPADASAAPMARRGDLETAKRASSRTNQIQASQAPKGDGDSDDVSTSSSAASSPMKGRQSSVAKAKNSRHRQAIHMAAEESPPTKGSGATPIEVSFQLDGFVGFGMAEESLPSSDSRPFVAARAAHHQTPGKGLARNMSGSALLQDLGCEGRPASKGSSRPPPPQTSKRAATPPTRVRADVASASSKPRGLLLSSEKAGVLYGKKTSLTVPFSTVPGSTGPT